MNQPTSSPQNKQKKGEGGRSKSKEKENVRKSSFLSFAFFAPIQDATQGSKEM